ncbi:MAG TPA: glycosyltransferase [Gemmatimonadales bacterium]|nr:glycosyltransferase [Gemmatimonadales bacterium]
MFAEALRELGEERGYRWEFFDEAAYTKLMLDRYGIAGRILRRGVRPAVVSATNLGLLARARRFRPDILLIVKGRDYWPSILRRIKRETGAFLVNFATDDPFNGKTTSRHLLKTIPVYDLYASPRRAVLEDIRRAGCRRVAYVRFGYKPSVHYPETPGTPEEEARFACDVAFIGGADSDRAAFFEDLLGRLLKQLPGVCLALYGGYWALYPRLRDFARGLAVGRDYRLAISGAKVVVNLVRRANRDGHVMRTFEVPACGGFMLAERTHEHEEIFPAGSGVDFFGSVEELVEKIAFYLRNDDARRRMARRARETVVFGRHTYKDRLGELVDLLSA